MDEDETVEKEFLDKNTTERILRLTTAYRKHVSWLKKWS